MALGRTYHWYREVLRDVTGPDKNIVSKLLRDMQQTGDLILSAPDDAKPYCGHYYKAFPIAHDVGTLRAANAQSLAVIWPAWNRCRKTASSGNCGAARDGWYVDGSDELQEGSWIFGNGEPLTFTNWESGQPDDDGWGFSEHCFWLIPPSGKWDDLIATPAGILSANGTAG